MITIDEFFKVEIKVGKVVEASDVEESKKLIRLIVDVGEEKPRTIFTGVRSYGFTSDDFVNKKFLFVTNLEPKKIMEEESQGMILAVGKDKPVFIEVESLEIGEIVR